MLGKLIKYELMSESKKYMMIYAVLGVFSVSLFIINSFIKKLGDFAFVNILSEVLTGITLLCSFAALALVLVFTIRRIYINIFRDEGYLMHTLPVPEWQHIITKVISCYVWEFVTLVVVAICAVIGSGSNLSKNISDFCEGFRQGFEATAGSGEQMNEFLGMYFAFILFSLILMPLTFTVYVYFCLAVGHSFAKNKVLMSIITYICVNVAVQIITCIFMALIGFANIGELNDLNDFTVVQGIMSSIFVYSVVMTAVLYTGLYIATNQIMKKRLNLE